MIACLDDISVVIDKLKQTISNRDVIVLLQGDLASGKTALVKHYVSSLGYEDNVTSPTFSIQTIYGKNIFHYDVYNKTLDEFLALGLLEEFDKSGVHFVEWGDDKLKNILDEYGFEVIVISIKKVEDKREYNIES